MKDLTGAHRGYEYQDLVTACRLVEVLLEMVGEVKVDKKLVPDDRFDDLTLEVINPPSRSRAQIKHTVTDDTPLSLSTFTTDSRDLRLDELAKAAAADRAGPGSAASSVEYRVIMRDASPQDEHLKKVLREATPDPGPYLPEWQTKRYRFDAEALWRGVVVPAVGRRKAGDVFEFLRGSDGIGRADLDWLCAHLVIETGAPAMSMDLRAPGPLEQILLTRVREGLGAGIYPNADRSAIDVAETLTRVARAARQGAMTVSRDELLYRTGLRHDFGAVVRSNPVDSALEVRRSDAVSELQSLVAQAAEGGGAVIAQGSPGQGKSWICQQLLERLAEDGWLIAEHYCYLGDADGDRLPRVMADSVFGSLLGRIADVDPDAVRAQRPRFAADENSLVGAVSAALKSHPRRPIALVVDGIDHVTRVRGVARDASDPSLSLVEALSALQLPTGSVLVLLSQPGAHLAPLMESGARIFDVPSLNRNQLRELAERHRVLPPGSEVAAASWSEKERTEQLLAALEERSAGNALYATYLCREVVDRLDTVDAAARVRALPAFDVDLNGYYEHLHRAVGPQGEAVADIIALLDMTITADELKEILPRQRHRVDHALKILSPVLVHTLEQGVRVYHESFSRFLRRAYEDEPIALQTLLGDVAEWLRRQGLYDDVRSFRCLLRVLADAGHDGEVTALIDQDFVSQAVSSGFPESMIRDNLAIGVRCASRLGDWGRVARYVELSRAAETYQNERYDSSVTDFADVPIALLGAQTVADRLLYNGRPVLPGRHGLKMCEEADRRGAVVPWSEYILEHEKQSQTENVAYGAEDDLKVELARIRGLLRLAAYSGDDPSSDQSIFVRLAAWLDDHSSQETAASVVGAVCDAFGPSAVPFLVSRQVAPGPTCLAFAEHLASSAHSPKESPRMWAAAAVGHGIADGSIHRLIKLGLNADDIADPAVADRLLTHMVEIQARDVAWKPTFVLGWLDAAVFCARHRPELLDAAEAQIEGSGWYRCWLRFTLALVRAEHRPGPADERSKAALHALELLSADLNPFAGEPRACDLYQLHPVIAATVRRAVQLLNDEDWRPAMDLLLKVSEGTTTSLNRMQNGPLQSELVLSIVAESASGERRTYARSLLDAQLENGYPWRFYSELAEQRLLSARFLIASNDIQGARHLWDEASRLLTAYGWRKDVTIWELIDAIPALEKAGLGQIRQRLADLQPLCQRVPLHTDGKETNHAPAEWLRLLASADPLALSEIVTAELLAECNDPNEDLHWARYELWRRWHKVADPLLSVALRLVIDSPPTQSDLEEIGRLADGDESLHGADIASWLLARGDERGGDYAASPKSSRELMKVEVPQQLPAGSAGLSRLIRSWHSFDSSSGYTASDLEDFVSEVCQRLLELAAADRREDATAALRAFVPSITHGSGHLLLEMVGKGLEEAGESALAVQAQVLAWARRTAKGGWRIFGGESSLGCLRRATELDPQLAARLVTEEIEHAVAAGRFGTLGITQAITIAFAHGALLAPGEDPRETALAIWDEAFTIIAGRLPRIHEADAPAHSYQPTETGDDRESQIDLAFVRTVLAGLSRAERPSKRLALLAIKKLCDERPDLAAEAMEGMLRSISDPATLTWLLLTVERTAAKPALAERCRTELATLSQGDHLTVRSIARRFLPEHAGVPLPPSDPALLRPSPSLAFADEEAEEHLRDCADHVHDRAGGRLALAESFVSGFADLVVRRVRGQMLQEPYQERAQAHYDAYIRRGEQLPDMYLAPEEVVEESVQVIASGARGARLAAGRSVGDPLVWEDLLGRCLADDPELPLLVESLRVPRPEIPLPPGYVPDLPEARPTTLPLNETIALAAGPLAGWRVLGSVEQWVPETADEGGASTVRFHFSGVEIRRPHDLTGLDSPPFSGARLQDWAGFPEWFFALQPDTAPLLGLTVRSEFARDASHGLGTPSMLLTPTWRLAAALSLESGTGPGIGLDDTEGPALELVTWRGRYGKSPSSKVGVDLSGCAVALRPDLIPALAAAFSSSPPGIRSFACH